MLTSYSSVSKNGSRFFNFSCFVSTFGAGGFIFAATVATVFMFGAGFGFGGLVAGGFGVGGGFAGGGVCFGGGVFGFGFLGTQPARAIETVNRNASSSSSKSA